MSKRWYVVQAFSGYEKSVMRSLHEQIALHGMEDRFGDILVPTEEVVNKGVLHISKDVFQYHL